ncbi:4Fe-4S binding protein [Brucepastera parasyntrophica]|uniref:4Fe-4S binding protein n=1 Tax=Brucepastera parasyntrophica TaxID=2880008 RepID=UPI0021086D9F|nr:4Fe-4S dicluster domain-containing protein [Brucepastera parasyntrophica]ULQ60021.1 4Fe-4S binding protein [Brucepastera parasyntrophica]
MISLLLHLLLIFISVFAIVLFYFCILFLIPERYRQRKYTSVSLQNEMDDEPPGSDVKNKNAVMRCNYISSEPRRFDSIGFSDCSIMQKNFRGDTVCPDGCLGLGSCLSVCPADAILIDKNAIMINGNCTGCGRCISACPRNLIILQPAGLHKIQVCAGEGRPNLSGACPTAANNFSFLA